MCSVTPGWAALAGVGRHCRLKSELWVEAYTWKAMVESAGSPGQSLHQLSLKLPVLSTHSLGLSSPALHCMGLVPTPQNAREPRRTTYTDKFIVGLPTRSSFPWESQWDPLQL